MSDAYFTIEVSCMQGAGTVTMDITEEDTPEGILEAAIEALGLQELVASGKFYPVFTNDREETRPVDEYPIGDFVRPGERLRLNAFGDVA